MPTAASRLIALEFFAFAGEGHLAAISMIPHANPEPH